MRQAAKSLHWLAAIFCCLARAAKGPMSQARQPRGSIPAVPCPSSRAAELRKWPLLLDVMGSRLQCEPMQALSTMEIMALEKMLTSTRAIFRVRSPGWQTLAYRKYASLPLERVAGRGWTKLNIIGGSGVPIAEHKSLASTSAPITWASSAVEAEQDLFLEIFNAF
ncbi:hypothetical protein PV05_11520 [Exophiala xenobiotica]|uniref:Uncharacterized protein n=1 Tax=Exophiala xenobiotica TaxID=348802 RepID=A0A0D2CJ38_9EURO|nr:uncharacterized protein PV05_11520 [Exophiala xenobiotica]KIW49882.1 hypothetical protein PV05_11520 [Exophiala xenobiotica]